MAASPETLFANVRRSDPLGLWSESGGLEYSRVKEFLGFSTADLAKVGGVSVPSVRLDARIPPDLRHRLEQIANICALVAEYFEGDPERTVLWFRTPNPMLGDVAPRDMIRLGRYKRLLKFVLDARSANSRGEKEARA